MTHDDAEHKNMRKETVNIRGAVMEDNKKQTKFSMSLFIYNEVSQKQSQLALLKLSEASFHFGETPRGFGFLIFFI